jgi:hypothetical protein
VDVKLVLVAVLAACSSKAHAVEDAKSAKPRDAAVMVPSGPYRTETSFPKGDVQIRVEWHDVPTVARASAGRTPCGTARAPSVSPTTTWGIPDALVMIDLDHGKAPVDPQARVVLEHCELSPRIALAGTAVTIASAMEAPVQVSLGGGQPARPLDAPPAKTQPLAIQLPVIGHAVTAPLELGTIYTITTPDSAALVVAAPTPYYAVTEPTGQVVLRDVPVGTFAVAALVPARAGQPARTGKATVTVTADALAEVTIDVTKP